MYTPLYIKTDNSLQNSIIKISDLIKFAKDNNIKSLAITDCNMYGVMDFYKMCISNDIKPIIGLEVLYNDKKIVFYAKNYDGYKNLIKLCTLFSERKLDLVDLEKYSSDLVCIIPCESLSIYKDLISLYKDIYIGYKNIEEFNSIKDTNKVYFNETLYLTKSDSKYIKYMDAIRSGVTVDLVEKRILNNYILTEEEFNKEQEESIDNNHAITDLCNVEIPFNQKLMPKFVNEDNLDSFTYLKKKCIEGLRKHFGNTVKEIYKTRLKYELDVINKMDFCDYFLITADYVNYAKENNIIVGSGRGSAVGSLVAYCLMITDVDPIKYNLLFERFLNPERVSMPDIDIDFEHEKREDVINYCINKYGKKRVMPIITFGTLGAKQALRDVGKAMNVDLHLIDNISKLIDSKKTLIENYNTSEKIKELLNRHDELKECYKVSLKLEGLKRHTSIHASGILMSRVDLDEVIPLDHSHEFYVSGYDHTYLEEIGLLKMDFLAIKNLTTIHDMIDSINKTYKTDIKFDEIPLNDSKTLEVFNKADTIGIFQFESDGMINFLKQLKVSSMEDLFAAIALFRPGPMQNIPSYVNRKHGIEKIDYLDPSLEPILKNTYGIMIYQEQIMQIARLMADYSLGEADILRKAMSKKKKDILLKEEEKFKTRALNKGYTSDVIDKVYSSMLKFAEYGFNKSHSVGYSIIAYKMAYLKEYYPKNFIAYLLSMEVNNNEKTKQYIYEAKSKGINILMPNINLSGTKYIIEESGIRYPLSSIKNIGISTSELIIKERENGEYTDIYDFIRRCYGKSVKSTTLESLIYSGAFDIFGYTKKTLINNLDLIINYGELIKDLDRTFALEPEIIETDEFDSKYLMEKELEIFGLYLTVNPITQLKNKYKGIVDLKEIELYFDKRISVILSIDKLKRIDTSKGEKMCFLTGSDEISQTVVVMFPKLYENSKDLKAGDIIKVRGRVEKRFDEYQLVANEITRLKY